MPIAPQRKQATAFPRGVLLPQSPPSSRCVAFFRPPQPRERRVVTSSTVHSKTPNLHQDEYFQWQYTVTQYVYTCSWLVASFLPSLPSLSLLLHLWSTRGLQSVPPLSLSRLPHHSATRERGDEDSLTCVTVHRSGGGAMCGCMEDLCFFFKYEKVRVENLRC